MRATMNAAGVTLTALFILVHRTAAFGPAKQGLSPRLTCATFDGQTFVLMPESYAQEDQCNLIVETLNAKNPDTDPSKKLSCLQITGPVASGSTDPHNWGRNCDDGMEDFGKLSPPFMINWILAARSYNDCPKVVDVIDTYFGDPNGVEVNCVVPAANTYKVAFGGTGPDGEYNCNKVADAMSQQFVATPAPTTTTTTTRTTQTTKRRPPPYGYVLESSGYCARRNGVLDTYIENQQECEDAAVSLRLQDTTAGGNTHDVLPYGCYYNPSSKALFWSLTGTKDDSDYGRRSICIAGSATSTTTTTRTTVHQYKNGDCQRVSTMSDGERCICFHGCDGPNCGGSAMSMGSFYPYCKSGTTQTCCG